MKLEQQIWIPRANPTPTEHLLQAYYLKPALIDRNVSHGLDLLRGKLCQARTIKFVRSAEAVHQRIWTYSAP